MKIKSKLKEMKVWENKKAFMYKAAFMGVYALFMWATTTHFQISFAEDTGTNIFDVANKLLSDIQRDLVLLSGAGAGIGVACGVFMKKFSMGKQDKVELGNKVIRDSLIGFFTLNALPFIFNFLSPYLGKS